METCAMALSAAGSDARMAGSRLPVLAVAEKLDIDEETMIRTVTLNHLITIYIKSKLGRLSAFCGVTVSGVGASCGIAYIMDKKKTTIKFAIQNMLGNVAGMICNGAKAGCAFKGIKLYYHRCAYYSYDYERSRNKI
ncbi:L-serine ammonia-lyase, iron-sulfur-dependent, subunit alpha [Bacillus thuringiensis]|uniref:L-serine ammonia-lyase, iron-sulfur-dependent, subunit alpha n=1 Tax=Bacillus thuringiensis TaxID=1428 RepID=UPI003393DAFF